MSKFVKSKENLAAALAKLDQVVENAIKKAFEDGKKQAKSPKGYQEKITALELKLAALENENTKLKIQLEQSSSAKIENDDSITDAIKKLDQLIEARKSS